MAETALERSTTTSPFSPSVSSNSLASKQGWFRASAAEMRSCGFFLSMRFSKSKVCLSKALYCSPQKVILLALFCASTSLQVFPGKALIPSSKMWKMSPKLKMSQTGSYLVFISLMLMTSGATKPGVPHRTKRYSCSLENSARPKSATTQSQLPSQRKIRFQGFRSRCMSFRVCISLSPPRMDAMTILVSWGLNLYLSLTLSYSSPPSSSSTTIQRELSDQKTQKSFMQLGWLRVRMTSISFMRHSFPFSSLQAASFEKAFTAQLRPSSIFSARQTDAKFPFPIFFLGLNCQWKPRWLSRVFRASRH